MQKTNVFVLLLVFLTYGWIEFEALILVGNVLGGLITFLGLFFTAFLGISLIRRLTAKVFMAWRSEYEKNDRGLSKLAEGLSILFGGLLLVIPGYFTDLIGIMCMVPIIRVFIGSIIIANFADLRLFADLRKKHRDTSSHYKNNAYGPQEITIDGEYKEK